MGRINAKATPRKATGLRQTEIVDAGMRILATEGPRQFTVERIAAEVGISGGAIFRHFASMEEILDAIVARMEEILFAGFPPAEADPLAALKSFFRSRTRVIRDHPAIARLLLMESPIPGSATGAREKRLSGMKRRSRGFVLGCLKNAAKNGALARGVGPEEATLLVLGAIHTVGPALGKHTGAKTGDQVITRTWNLIERALCRDIAPGRD